MASTADFLASLDAPLQAPVLIPLDDIEPDPTNVRSDFRPVDGVIPVEVSEALEHFADGIDRDKLMHPITVTETNDGRYRIVVGERRWRAFLLNRERGKPHYDAIPAYVRDDLKGPAAALAQLAENLQREDVTDLDVATKLKATLEAYPELQKQQLAAMLKKPASYISRILKLVDPRFKDVVDSGVITYASLLEQFSTLPKKKQDELVAVAKEQKRTITSGDIVKARKKDKVPDAVANDVAKVLAEFAPQEEQYEAAHAAASREKAQSKQIVDHGGEPVFPRDAVPYGAPGAFDVRVTLAQLVLLARSEAFLEGADAMDQTVTLSLKPDDIRHALNQIGTNAPKDDSKLPMALLKGVNSFF